MAKVETIQNPKSKLTRVILAGILGTIAFNGVMYVDMEITGIPLDIVTLMGSITVGESEHTQTIGHTIHIANGIGLALLFGYVVLPISQRIKKLPVMVYAIVFVIIELIIAVWFVMFPMIGAGIAGFDIAPEVAVITLVRHVVFGIVLGLVVKN